MSIWELAEAHRLAGRAGHGGSRVGTRQGAPQTHKATFCHVGWKATGQGPVVSWGCAGGEKQMLG